MPTARQIADEVLDTPITRQGEVPPWVGKPGETTTTLRNEIAWMTSLNWLLAEKPNTQILDRLDDLVAAGTAGEPRLTPADHDAIARRVLELLAEHPLAPRGT